MASSFDEYKKLHEQALAEAEANKQQIQQRQVQHTVNGVDPTHQYKAWDDVWGNVYMSDLTTGQTKRTHNNLINVGAPRELSRGTVVEDLGQAVTGAMQRQGANYKSAGATLLLGMADLFNGKDPYQPEVGSFLWRMQQGAQADTALANQTLADAKYGRGKVGSLVMDLTSGAVDLASDALLTAATGGASIGGKLGITAGLGAMGLRSFGGGAEEAREQGKSTGQQFITGLKSAGIEMLTEKIGGPFEKAYGPSALTKFNSDLVSKLSKNAGMQFVLGRLKDAGDEAFEEMLSDVLNPLADRVLKLDNGEGWERLWTKEGMSQMAYDGLVGGLLGLFGGMAEGLSPEQRAQAAVENMDNAMNASRNGKSIGAELEQDTEGRVATAVTNQASQTAPEVPFTVGAQEVKEAPVAPAPTQTPPTPPTAVKQETGEFNAERDEVIPDDDAEPRKNLEEVSRWGKNEPKPVEDTTDAEKEGKEFSPEETADVFHGEADVGRLRSLAEQEKEQDRRQAEYFEKKDAVSAEKASQTSADLLVEQSKVSEPAKAEAKAEPAKSGADLLAEQAEKKPKKIRKKSTKKKAKSGADVLTEAAEEKPKTKTEEKAEAKPSTPKEAESKVRDVAYSAIERKLGKAAEKATTILHKSKGSDHQIAGPKDSRRPKDVQIKLSGENLTHNTVRGDKATAGVTNTAFKNKLKKLFGDKQVVITGQTVNTFDDTERLVIPKGIWGSSYKAEDGTVTGREFVVNSLSVDGKPLTGAEYYKALDKLKLKAGPRRDTKSSAYRSAKAETFEERRQYIDNRNVDINERLRYAEEMEEVDYVDAIEEFTERYIAEETEHGEFTGTPELFEKQLDKFIEQYEKDHDYSWVIDGEEVKRRDNRRNVIYALEDPEFMQSFIDEAQESADARAARIGRAPTYVMSTDEIASDIEKGIIENIKPVTNDNGEREDIDSGTFVIELDGAKSPYNMTATYHYPDGNKGGGYTIEIFHNKAIADNDVRVIRFNAPTLDGVAKEAAQALHDYERGDETKFYALEARVDMTRKQMADELRKQAPEKGYTGTYKVGPWSLEVEPYYKWWHGERVVGGYSLKVYDGDALIWDKKSANKKNKKTGKETEPNMVQRAASALHQLNYENGTFHLFDILTKANRKEYTVDLNQALMPKERQEAKVYKDLDLRTFDSAFEPKVVEYNGKLYEVSQAYATKKGDTIQNIIYEVDEQRRRVDNTEASVNIKTATSPEAAIQYALDHNMFKDITSDESMKEAQDYAQKKGVKYAQKKGNLHDGISPEWDNGVNVAGGVQNNEGATGNPEAANGGNEEAAGQAARRALKTGEKVSLDQLFGEEGYDSEANLTYVSPKDYTPGQRANAREVKRITGKDVRYVRGRWGNEFDPDGTSRAVALTSQKGEIVFNLDYYEYGQSKGSKVSERNILLHESFHSLAAQHPALLVFARKALNNFYGEKSAQQYAKTYADKMYKPEDAAAFFDKNGEYPSNVYSEMCADAFGGSFRWGINMGKASNSIRFEVNRAMEALLANPKAAEQLNNAAKNKAEKLSMFEGESAEDADERPERPKYSEVEAELNARDSGIEELEAPSSEDKAKSTFGKDYEKVQKSADDFDGIETRFDEEAFQKSDKGQDKKTRNKLKKLREAFRNAATTGDVETLFSIYEDLQSDSNLSNFYNEEIQEDIDNWRKLSDPNLDSYNEGAAPYAAARTMQKMAHKFKLANEYQQTLSKMNETLRGSKNGVMRKIGKSEKLTSAVARALVRWQINPDTVFKMIDAFDKGNAGEGYKLAKELQEAHREKYRVLRESRAKFDKASDLKGYQDFAFGKQTVKDYSGREWDMRSALSVIKAIDTIRSTSGKKLGGTDGFGVMDSKGNVEFIDMKDVDAIKLYESLKSGLSDVAIKYGELATEAFNDVKEPLRAKYKQNNGVDIGMVGDEDTRLGDKKGVEKAVYSPLSYVDKNGNVYQFDIAKQETYNNIPRLLRERSDAGGTYILIKPYTEVTGKYFEQVSNYLAYSTFNEKMRGLGKGSSYETGLGNTLADVFGKDMGNWYKSYVEDLATYQNEDDVEGVNSLLRQGRQQLQQGALLFSVSVPMKQISSYWAASGILHPDSLIKNYRIKLLKPKNSSDAATMLASRAMGNLEQSAAEAANDAKKWLGKLKYSSKFIELAANAINQMDYNTVSNLLSATEYDVLKYQFGGDKSVIGTDEYKAAVEEKFQDVVDRSQPNFDKQMRAEYGRTDNEIVRMLSMFRTQQTQNLNLLATAIGEYRASKGTANQAKATETLKQTIAGQTALAFSLSMLTILADMLLHRQKKYEDDEEEIDGGKVLARLGINAIEASAGTLWFGDAVAKWAIDRISGGSTKEFYGVNMGVISTVSDILENFETAIKTPTRSNIKKCAGNIATLMGIPLNNAYSMLNSAIMYAKDVTGDNEGDYDDILRYLDAQTKAAKKAEEKAAKEAAKAEAKSGADMLADTAKQNSSQSELNSQEATEKAPVSGYLTKPYNALVEAGMSSQRSQEVLSQMDTDSNNSVKQSEMIAYYKAHPEDEAYVEAMWNSYGYKTTWEKAKQKAG